MSELERSELQDAINELDYTCTRGGARLSIIGARRKVICVSEERGTVRVDLANRPFELLALMASRGGKAVTREMFYSAFYPYYRPDPRIFNVFISKTKKTLRQASGGESFIETAWGRGYMLPTPEEQLQAQQPNQCPIDPNTQRALQDLPAPSTKRWVAKRKARVVAAIQKNIITVEQAQALYQLSKEELALWGTTLEKFGLPGLRTTRILEYQNRLPE